MIYPRLFKKFESVRWNLENDIPWHQFNQKKISERQLYSIKMNAILEWSAMPTAEMFLRDYSHDVDFSAFMSIWFFEEQKHSLALLEYLRRFAPHYLPTEKELAAVRFSFDSAPPLESLALHFCGEIRLNQWYRCAREWHTEPVIQQIYTFLSNDEARHSRAYFEYMKRALLLYNQEARLAFAKIGVLMTNSRVNKAMHPTNLHVNKALFPNDTVNGKLPDPKWLENWLNNEIHFDDKWETKVSVAILSSLSHLFDISCHSSHQLREYRKSLLFDQQSLVGAV